jgi:hypothetical protein
VSTEKDNWQRLGLLKAIPLEEHFSPAKAKEGFYSSRLKEVLKQPLPLDDDGNARPARTVGDALAELERQAAELIAAKTTRINNLVVMRKAARELGVPVQEGELKRLLADAKRQTLDRADGVGDRPLSRAPVPWLVDGLLMRGCLNLVIGAPKVGKTSLFTGLFGAWAGGSRSYLGLPLVGPCPRVLIVGPDQPECDWAALLAACGLLDGHDRLRRNVVVDLFTAGQSLQLDDEGIEKIALYAADHPGLIVLIDSLAACTRLLGISENDAEIAGPLMALLEALEPHGATPVLIHHSGKANLSGAPSIASRGSSAIPAIASHLVSLSRLTDGQPSAPGAPADRRVIIKTEGRGGSPIELLAERTDAGWISHGDAETVQAARWRQQQESQLPDRQGQALTEVRDRWEVDHLPMDAQTLADILDLGGDGRRKAQATLDALTRRGLLESEVQSTGYSRRKVFRPVGSGSGGAGGGVSLEPSEPSEPSEPPSGPPSLSLENPVKYTDRRDRRDRSPTGTHPPPEPPSLRTPPNPDSEPPAPPEALVALLLKLRAERPHDAAHTIALQLNQPGVNGREVKAWLPWLDLALGPQRKPGSNDS